MKKSTTLVVTGITLSALVVGLVASTRANAVTASSTSSSGQALEIGPPVINLSADPGTTVKTTISLRDVSPTNLLVTGQINDFIAEGEDGTPKILLNGESSPYSFKSWVSPLASLTLTPKQLKTLTVTSSPVSKVTSERSPTASRATISSPSTTSSRSAPNGAEALRKRPEPAKM